MSLEVDGKNYETDEEGYLANLSDWTPQLCDAMAHADNNSLSDNRYCHSLLPDCFPYVRP